jgi:hypothetical protein
MHTRRRSETQGPCFFEGTPPWSRTSYPTCRAPTSLWARRRAAVCQLGHPAHGLSNGLCPCGILFRARLRYRALAQPAATPPLRRPRRAVSRRTYAYTAVHRLQSLRQHACQLLYHQTQSLILAAGPWHRCVEKEDSVSTTASLHTSFAKQELMCFADEEYCINQVILY